MSREAAIAAAEAYFDDGGFVADLARRVAIPTESQVEERLPVLRAYLADEIAPSLARLGFNSEIVDNPVRGGPILIAERREEGAATTVFGYGHGDVIRGLEPQWRDGLSPWRLQREGDRLYGRGTADNKGQHTINLAALESVLKTRGRLGFNAVLLIETGEEIGSPGLREVCRQYKDRLAADVLIASDGPRLAPERPTIFLGARGAMNFDLSVELREGGHHSGNWGGLLANPGIVLAHALASISSDKGAIKIKEWKPSHLPNSVRMALADCTIEGGEDAPEIDPDWGEPGFTPSEEGVRLVQLRGARLHHRQPRQPGQCDPAERQGDLPDPLCRRGRPGKLPAGAAPPPRCARLSDGPDRALDKGLFSGDPARPRPSLGALGGRLDQRDHGQAPAILPNLGGSLPNDIFANDLGLPTVWVPHSYASCSQHAPNEHMLAPVAREALAVMAGIYWDLGEGGGAALPEGGEGKVHAARKIAGGDGQAPC